MTLYVWAAVILAVVGFVIWLYVAGRSAGKSAIAADVAEETADVLRKQAQAQADAPQGKDAVVSRLREKGL
jgi:predicted kinase